VSNAEISDRPTLPLSQRRLPTLAVLALAAAFILIVGLYVLTAYRFVEAFPNGDPHSYSPHAYPWSEMLLNWQGGFGRRSLVGEIAYQLDSLISARWLISGLLLSAYVFVAVWVFFLAASNISLATILFVLSPATLLFSVNDVGSFGRKDIFIIAAFVLSMMSAGHLSRTRAVIVAMALFSVVGLIVEAAWFYFPLTIAAVMLSHGGQANARWQAGVWAVAGVYLALCFWFVLALDSGVGRGGMIAASWQELYPTAYTNSLKAALVW
jgi:hypothetical protein